MIDPFDPKVIHNQTELDWSCFMSEQSCNVFDFMTSKLQWVIHNDVFICNATIFLKSVEASFDLGTDTPWVVHKCVEIVL